MSELSPTATEVIMTYTERYVVGLSRMEVEVEVMDHVHGLYVFEWKLDLSS